VITTRYQQEKNLFSISVTDNGHGILPEVQDKIFVPFFTTKQRGSGIGLSLCKQIMTLHGGSISVKSEEGVGSTFTLKFFCK
ncbi:MAG: ATP-binding protein, partial [Bacteroides sp.]|nr:ATP-binding protein [Bacteroides sp.]